MRTILKRLKDLLQDAKYLRKDMDCLSETEMDGLVNDIENILEEFRRIMK